MTRQKTNQILPNIFSLERSWGVAVVQQPVRLHDEASAYHLHHWWWWWWRCRWHQPWHRSSGHPAASQDAPGTLLRAQKQSRHWCGLYSFWPEKQMTKHVSGQASDNKRYTQTRTTLTLWLKSTFSPLRKVMRDSSAFLLSSKSSITMADMVLVKQRTDDLKDRSPVRMMGMWRTLSFSFTV